MPQHCPDEHVDHLLAVSHTLLNAASGAKAAAAIALRKPPANVQALRHKIIVLRTLMTAFTETHTEPLHDAGYQSVLDHLHIQRGNLSASLQLLLELA